MNKDEFDIFRDDRENFPQGISSQTVSEPEAPSALTRVEFADMVEERPHILIIDDDPIVLELLGHTLERKYHVVLCQNGEQGIEAVNADISTVLLDIKMEGKDGFETFLEIKKRFPHLPIIFHTAYQDLKDPYEIMNYYRPFGYISKEGNSAELMDTITSASNYYQQIRKNELLIEHYSRFVPKEFLRLLEKESVLDVQLGDQIQKEMSILFCDIRAFTSLSENMSPQENFRFLNSYLKHMGPIVREHQGFIDKYIGDAIMAIFDRDADQAVGAAIEMIRLLEEYNDGRARAGYRPIRIGIGINTGKMMVGTIGEKNRMEGTVISDAVNLAARMETLTKDYGASVLISNHTFLNLKDPSEYKIRFIDQVQVKGKEEKVVIYEIYDADPPEIQEKKWETSSIFQEAWLLFQDKSFGQAKNLLEECVAKYPGDKAAQKYLERCQQELKTDSFI